MASYANIQKRMRCLLPPLVVLQSAQHVTVQKQTETRIALKYGGVWLARMSLAGDSARSLHPQL